MKLFSTAFMQLAARLMGAGWAEQYFEERYLEFRRKHVRLITRWYRTGRTGEVEHPQKIFQYFNDGATKPSESFINRARKHFIDLVQYDDAEDAKVRRIAKWVDSVTRYTRDSDKWGSPEYWSSPFDLFAEFEELGYVEDDCDGSAALIWWGCVLVGISPERVFMWAGNASRAGRPYGHANLLYDPLHKAGMYHVEGTFLHRENARNWLGYRFGCERYPETWFYFNDRTAHSVA